MTTLTISIHTRAARSVTKEAGHPTSQRSHAETLDRMWRIPVTILSGFLGVGQSPPERTGRARGAAIGRQTRAGA